MPPSSPGPGSGAVVSDSPTKLYDLVLAQLALLLDAARAVVDGVRFGEVEEDDVTSPTFCLVGEYPGRVPVWHIDAYRLASAAALEDLGLELERQQERAVLIEWADKVLDALPVYRLTLSLEHQPPGRRVSLQASGPLSASCLAELRARWEGA